MLPLVTVLQLLLLEESGYLGYVDGLEDMKQFAPDLVSEGRRQDLV